MFCFLSIATLVYQRAIVKHQYMGNSAHPRIHIHRSGVTRGTCQGQLPWDQHGPLWNFVGISQAMGFPREESLPHIKYKIIQAEMNHAYKGPIERNRGKGSGTLKPSIYLSIHPSIDPSIHLSTYLSYPSHLSYPSDLSDLSYLYN